MALEGTIRDFGLADILQLIGIQRKTGVLTLDNRGETVTVKFLDGQVVGAETGQRNLEDLLGSVLVRTGRITEGQLQEALRIQKRTLQRLGYIIVNQRYVSEVDLVEALRIQVTQIVYRLFRWRDGKYQFSPMDHLEYDSDHLEPLSAETILMEGARMIDEWPIIERRVKSASMVLRKTREGADRAVPVLSPAGEDIDLGFLDGGDAPRAPKDGLTTEERDVLHMVDGASTVQDLVDSSPLGEFDVYRSLYELMSKGLIEEFHVSPVAVVAPAAETGRRFAGAVAVAAVWALALVGAASLPGNPATPWRLAGQSQETELLRTYVARNRIEALERALDAYYFDRGALPEVLDRLAEGGYVLPTNLIDPWGRPFVLHRDASGYTIAAERPGSGLRDDLQVRHRFSPSQRMVLDGGTTERAAPTP